VTGETNDKTTFNLSEQTYERLRSDILHGVLRPNERLIELDLADRLKVSRTPIRESFKRLAAEGLVVNRRRGWVVYEYTFDEIRQIYETRMALEGYAARLAADRATAEQLAHVNAIFNHPDHFRAATHQLLVIENEKFHDAINTSAGNQKLLDLIRHTRIYYFNNRIAALYTANDVQDARNRHEQIVYALNTHDPDQAERATREDIRVALGIIQSRLA
jgi:DNA-binding GntR family transcriptional regulator